MDAETRRVMKEALARMGTWTERDGAELEASVKLAAQFFGTAGPGRGGGW